MSVARRERANALRALAMDAVQAANSGHPGMPMGMADIAEVLWTDHLRHDPANPAWPDRDRFVLSNGHGSMLLYGLLHLSGYDLGIGDLKSFRQLHSRTPGHPEHGLTPGVETTTGPLGQGLANAVGMAVAERRLAAEFNRPGHALVDHRTFVFCGDGDLMEGISHEACSLAGTLGLGKLVVLYDDNGISIDGAVNGWFSDDTPGRFRAYGWQVIEAVDGHDAQAIEQALAEASADTARPTLICCRTVIGYGAPNKRGTAGVHGAPLGDDEIAAARAELDWPHAPFEVPDAVRAAWDCRERGAASRAQWQQTLAAYREQWPAEAAEFERRMAGELPAAWADAGAAAVTALAERGKSVATRQACKDVLDLIAPALPELFGGSADLTDSNKTRWDGAETFDREHPQGQYLYYGVREFGMSAMLNGMALHGGLLPFAGTFLTFSDYARNALRLAALMRQRVVFVYSHDSIGLGEDGPTHQPIEHLASLRLIPGLSVWRPCDAVETAVAWQQAIEQEGPSVLATSRQKLPHQSRDAVALADIARGGYVLAGGEDDPDAILIATGSEVGLAMQARELLLSQGVTVRVVSMPCVEVFDAQPQAYRDQVLPPAVTARVAIEAGVPDGWWRHVGSGGQCFGISSFGESAPADAVFEHFHFSAADLARVVEQVMAGNRVELQSP